MRPVRLEFVPTVPYRRPLGALLAVIAVLIMAGGWTWSQQSAERQRLMQSTQALKVQIEQASRGGAASEAAAQTPAHRAAMQLLEHDWNELYDLLEGLEVPGARLLLLSAALGPERVRIEVELTDWAVVPPLTDALNQGGLGRWELVSASAVDSAVGGAGRIRAVWEQIESHLATRRAPGR